MEIVSVIFASEAIEICEESKILKYTLNFFRVVLYLGDVVNLPSLVRQFRL